MTIASASLRGRIGLSRAEWARALNVNERTVARWEEGQEPSGVAAEVMRGILSALDEGADPKRVGRLVSLGVGGLLFTELMRQTQATE